MKLIMRLLLMFMLLALSFVYVSTIFAGDFGGNIKINGELRARMEGNDKDFDKTPLKRIV